LFFVSKQNKLLAQCTNAIQNYPYNEGFELSDGGWKSGGIANDWALGTPRKKVINKAATGNNCWITGGLTNGSYANGAASWLQSPCFDFSSLKQPYISFRIFWETERRFDGASFEFSIDNGVTWQTLGNANDVVNCPNSNWFNTNNITALGRTGWSGNIQTISSCVGGTGGGFGKWVTASHEIAALAGQKTVAFRFVFAAGTVCNDFDGFAVDDIYVGEAPTLLANFSFSCSNNKSISFDADAIPCPGTYTWDFGDIASGTQNIASTQNATHIFSNVGLFQVRLTVSLPGFIPVSIVKTVDVIDVGINELQPVDCFGNKTATLEALVAGVSNNYTFKWNGNSSLQNIFLSNVGAGNYQVEVKNMQGCAEANITVTEPNKLQVTNTKKDALCTANGTIDVIVNGGTPNYQYSWLPNVSSTNKAQQLAAGNYTIQITDSRLCSITEQVQVLSLPNTLTVNLGKDTLICEGEQLLLQPGSFSVYKWQDNSNNPSFNVVKTGNYAVQVTDVNGCVATDNIQVTVDCSDVFFPTAFTPDGNGINDFFGPIGNVGVLRNYRMQVYNRYGQVVFETNNPLKKWDGRINGFLATGTFVYYAQYSIAGRRNAYQKGTLVLVR